MRESRSTESFAFAFEPPLDTWARWFAIVPTRSFVDRDVSSWILPRERNVTAWRQTRNARNGSAEPNAGCSHGIA